MRLSAARHDGLHLRSVTLRSADTVRPDALRARFALERALHAVDVRAAGLPPEAVLIVRRMAVGGDGVASRGSGGATTLAQQVDAALREQGRTARRPWRDPGAMAADAVWFEDEDELAACLVRDWLRGLAAQRWWWRSVLAGAGIDVWLRTQLLPRGERLAPTLQRLAAVSLAAVWVARMDDADASTGFDALARAYALPHAHEVVVDATQDRSDAPDGRGRTVVMPGRSRAHAQTAARRRLQRIVPELGATAWRPAQARLLAYALAVLRAPSEARTRAFADDVAAWRPAPERARAAAPADDAADADVTGSGDHDIGRDGIGQGMSSRSRVATARRRQNGAMRADADMAVPMARDGSRQQRVSSAVPLSKRASGFVTAQDDFDARDPRRSAAESAAATRAEAMPAIEPPLSAVDAPFATVDAARVGEIAPVAMSAAIARTLSTHHGGLFYVLNAALSLGVYGDFSMPRTQGMSLSPWDLMAWLGLHWFGRAFRRDPLWRLLAELAGRSPKRAPSWRIDPPSHWEPDDDWLRAWAPIAMLDHGVDRRLRRLHVLHPDGFAVFDVPRDTRLRPASQARALCLTRASTARTRLRASNTAGTLPADLGLRWLHRFADYLAARFMRALGTTSPRAAVALLCRHTAEVQSDASRVDVALSLSTLPLPVRIAGLDRDPGWIPAAGRDIRFHFS